MKLDKLPVFLVVMLVFSVSVAAFTPGAGSMNISPLNIALTEAVTLAGACSDADGAANITSCGFEGTVGAIQFDQSGALVISNATDAQCSWNGDLNSYAGDVEYRLWCDDGDGRQYGVYNEDNAIKRDYTSAKAQLSSINFTNTTSFNMSFRINYTFTGDDGDGAPVRWEHNITRSLPTGTTQWWVCEGQSSNCSCTPKASGSGTSANWPANTSFTGAEYETLCYVYENAVSFINSTWQTDTSQVSNATLQYIGSRLVLTETVGENFYFSYDLFSALPVGAMCTASCSSSTLLSSGSAGWQATAQASGDWADQSFTQYTNLTDWGTNASLTNTSFIRNITIIIPLNDTAGGIHRPNSEYALVFNDGGTSSVLTLNICANSDSEVETNYSITSANSNQYGACKKDTDSNGIADYVRILVLSLPAQLQAGGLLNTPPTLDLNIPNQSWTSGSSATVNLANYFSDADGDTLTYISNGTVSITITIAGSTATLTPAASWTGTEYVTFTATDGVYNTTSNNITLTVTAADTPPGDGGNGGGGGGRSSTAKTNTTKAQSFGQLKYEIENVEYSTSSMADSEITQLIKTYSLETESGLALTSAETLVESTKKNSNLVSSSRSIRLVGGKPQMTLTIRSTSDKTLANVIVIDTIPKTLASTADELEINAPSADVRILEDDPVVLFTYAELLPKSSKRIVYTITNKKQGITIEGMDAPAVLVGGEVVEEQTYTEEQMLSAAPRENVIINKKDNSFWGTGNGITGFVVSYVGENKSTIWLIFGGSMLTATLIFIFAKQRWKKHEKHQTYDGKTSAEEPSESDKNKLH